MTVTEKIAAFLSLIGPVSSGEVRMRLTDADALALVAEKGAANMPNAEFVVEAYEPFATIFASTPPPPSEPTALAAWSGEFMAKRQAFWRALSGMTVDGVVILEVPL